MINPNFKVKPEIEKDDYGKFIVEPLQEGYGQTLGNSLRRVLLTSIPGAAVTSVKINGVSHQFSTLPGMKEDIVELILNVKKIRLRLHGEKSAEIRLSINGPKEVTAGDIETPADVEIVNKNLYIATLADKKTKLDMELKVEQGMGYSPSEERKISTVGVIPVDATFSPVIRVNYKVEATRVAQMTNLDKLIFEVWTDGTVNPFEAVKEAAKILVALFIQIYEPKAVVEETGVAVTPAISDEILKMTIEELDLPTRIFNSLMNGGIATVGQLLGTPKKELLRIKNLGSKSLSIVEERLREKGVALTV
jgi:DNA-directed RNA polymerase subunit alpha